MRTTDTRWSMLVTLGLVALLTGCGSSGTGEVPPGNGSIVAQPEAWGYTRSVTALAARATTPVNYNVTLAYGGNDPLNNIPIYIYGGVGDEVFFVEANGQLAGPFVFDPSGRPIIATPNTGGTLQVVYFPIIPAGSLGDVTQTVSFVSGALRSQSDINFACVDAGATTCP